jgi:PAS domain S-box-containing protein/putative nucleotidyltransferase with HDIG domain
VKPIYLKGREPVAAKKKKKLTCHLTNKESERDIKAVIDSLPFYVLLVDQDHCIVLANKAAEKAFGKKFAEVQGGYCPLVVHGMDEPYPGCPLEESASKNKPLTRDLYDEKTNRWISAAIYPTKMKTAEGKNIYFHTSTDITHHKRALAALEESEKQYRSIFDNAVEGIAQTTTDGTLVAANMAFARIMGFKSSEEMLKKTRIMTGLIAQPEQSREISRRLRENQRVDDMEIELARADGKTIWVSISMHLLTEDENGPVIYEGMTIDITERKKAEERAQKNLHRLEAAFHGLIETLSLTLETRDPYTASHQHKVAKLSGAIAEEIGLPKGEIDSLNMAATVHDIGKIYVPSEILNKPGRLSDLEFTLIKTHVEAGYGILKDIQFRDPIAEMVRQHHERLDGSGYPRGLKSGQILSPAKIIAVADVVEAMSSHRPYRAALGIDAALAEIEDNKGKLYDPDAVDACLRLFREKGFKF